MRNEFFENDEIENSYAERLNIDSKKYYEINIEELRVSRRLRNLLLRTQMKTLSDVLKLTPCEVREIKHCGVKTIQELENYIYSLRKNPDIIHVQNIKIEIEEERTFADIYNLSIENYDKCSVENYDMSVRLENVFKQNNIETIGKLLRYTATDFISIKNCGISTFKEAIQLMEEIQKHPFEYRAFNRERIEELLTKMPRDRIIKKVSPFVKIYGLCSDDMMTQYYHSKDAKIEDIKTLNIVEEVDYSELEDFLDQLSFDLSNEIKKIITTVLKDERITSILEMRLSGKTLNDVGNLLGITRERVRQIEKKAIIKFEQLQKSFNILRAISAEENGDDTLNEYQIEKYAGVYAKILFYMLLKVNTQEYVFDSTSEYFVLDPEMIMLKVNEYTDLLPDAFEEKEFDKIVKSGFEEYGIPEDLLGKTISEIYLHTGTMYHRNRLTLKRVYESVLEKKYPNGLRIDNESIETFREQIIVEYGNINLPHNNRAIVARISDVGILCNRGMYKSKKDSYISKELLNKICTYIKASPQELFLINTIYFKFESELNEQGVDNKYYLQGILHESFKDEFIFKRDYISKTKNARASDLYKKIVGTVAQSEIPISRKSLQSAFSGITDVVLNFALDDSNVLNYFGQYFYAKHIRIENDEENIMRGIINQLVMDDGTHHIKEIHFEVQKKMSSMLLRNYIMFPFQFFSFAEYLYGEEYEMKRPFIARKNVVIERTKERLLEFIYEKEEITISEINLFAKENHMIIYNMREYIDSLNENYLWKNRNMIIKESNLGLEKTNIEKLLNCIYEEIVRKGSVPIRSLECLFSVSLGTVKIDEWLIYSLISKYGIDIETKTSRIHFKNAIPVVGLKGKVSTDGIRCDEIEDVEISSGDLDEIDALLIDIDAVDEWM